MIPFKTKLTLLFDTRVLREHIFNTSHESHNWTKMFSCHYNDVIMGAIASQITSLTIVYSTVYSGADKRKHQSSASLVFVRGIHRGPVNSPHKWPVTRKMFPFDDVIMMVYGLAWRSVNTPTRVLLWCLSWVRQKRSKRQNKNQVSAQNVRRDGTNIYHFNHIMKP